MTQSVKSPREIFIFEVQTTTRAHSIKYYFLWSHMKTSPAEQAKGHFAHFVKRAQHGKVENHLTDRRAILMRHFRRNSRGLNLRSSKTNPETIACSANALNTGPRRLNGKLLSYLTLGRSFGGLTASCSSSLLSHIISPLLSLS